jgi:hypothetical protein
LNGIEHREDRKNAHCYAHNRNGIRPASGPP